MPKTIPPRARWHWLHATLLVLAASCASTPAPDVPAGEAQAESGMPAAEGTISLVTFNLYHDKAEWPQRRVQVIETLRALHPDAIALQEVIGHETLRNQAEDLAEALGYDAYFLSTDAEGKPLRYGNALLTRHPVLARDWTRLRPLEDSRTAGHVRIAIDGRAVNLYVTHLNYKDEAQGAAMRREQLADLLAFIDRTDGGAPSIVAGDFNASSNAPELGAMGAAYVNAYDALHPDANADPATHATLNPHYFPEDRRRIDHVYLQRGAFESVEGRVVLDRERPRGTWPSDHFGVLARFRLAPPDAARGWRDASLSPDARAGALLAGMTMDEKFRLLRAEFGEDSAKHPAPGTIGSAGYVPADARLGIPALHETDAGLGITRDGLSGKGATSLPAGLAVAASWDPGIARAGGEMIGRQAWRKGFNVLLSGSVNLQRDPRNGRNFEYAGEDPLLAGTVVGHAIAGVQSQHVVSTMKHYAMNDLETARNTHDALVGEQAMRESDLLAFDIAHGIGRPGSVMCAYNKVNGTHACEHDALLNGILKGEWRFDGWVMSDWGGVHSAAKAANAGLDQQSAGEVFDKQVFFDKPLRKALADGEVPQARIDDMARRILRAMFANGLFDVPAKPTPIDWDGDGAVSRRAAEAGAVLLRNEGALLPLSKSTASIAVIGGHADKGVMAGGGSSSVADPGGNPVAHLEPKDWPGPIRFHPSAPLAAIRALAPGAKVRFVEGSDAREAARIAGESDVAIVFANQWAAESFDNATMELPDAQDALVAAVAAANPRTVVVLQTNGPVTLPWLGEVGAVLEAWYPGARGGEAIANLLFGEVAPSGRLPVTWPRDTSQLPRPVIVGAGFRTKVQPSQAVDYRIEGADVGYKWFERKALQPVFAFGHGLTYTTFRHANLKVVEGDGPLRVYFDVTNTGARAGSDVPQLYLEFPAGSATTSRLVGWQKVSLAPGETQRVGIVIDPKLRASWDAASGQWRAAAGRHAIAVGSSATERTLRHPIDLPAESFPAGERR